MRQFLITKMVCSECGNTLELTYDIPTTGSNYSVGEPTGANMVEQLIAVMPCETCKRPIDNLIAAAKVIANA